MIPHVLDFDDFDLENFQNKTVGEFYHRLSNLFYSSETQFQTVSQDGKCHCKKELFQAIDERVRRRECEEEKESE